MTRTRTGAPARDADVGAAGTPTHSWPLHLVSAPHGVTTEANSRHPRMPYGSWHARSVGDLRTVCGISAVTWEYFWTLSFPEAGKRTCMSCVRELCAQRADTKAAAQLAQEPAR